MLLRDSRLLHSFISSVMGLNSERVDLVHTMSPQQPTDKNGPPESGKQLWPIAVADHMNHSLDRLVGNARAEPRN